MNENGNPIWLKDGSFLWFSERSGFKHLYRYSADGELLEAGHHRRGKFARSTAWTRTAASLLRGHRAESDRHRHLPDQLDGTGLTRLSQGDGTHRAIFNPDFTLYIGIWSNVTTPTQVRLHRTDGSEGPGHRRQPGFVLADYSGCRRPSSCR